MRDAACPLSTRGGGVFVDEFGFVSAVSQLTPAPCTAWRRGGGSAERGRRGGGRCAPRRGRKVVGIHVRRDWDTLRQEGMEIEWSRSVGYSDAHMTS